MRIIEAQVLAKVQLNEWVEAEVEDDATEQEIREALLEEAPNVFGELIDLSNGLELTYEIDFIREE